MKIVKFAFILMGNEFHPDRDFAILKNDMNDSAMFGVSSVEDACILAGKLKNQGYQCIELCGAFGKEGARRVKEAAGEQVAVGYVVHSAEQDELFEKVFS